MYTIVTFDCKFKTNKENIEKILQHYGLRKVQCSLYLGELDNSEHEQLFENVNEIIKENDSFLMFPICKNCFSKKELCGHEIKFKNDLFRVY